MSIINPASGQTPPKWRGIKTTQVPKHEDKAVTIVNRLGQKSFSLPRIDDGKRWAGFPGLAGTAKKIANLIPRDITIYVEPFAGAARVFQELKKLNETPQYYILNEKSTFINEWLKREFGYHSRVKIYKKDFVQAIKKFDSKNTFFLIDPPWNKSFYDQGFSVFNRETVADYEDEILKVCSKLQGKFIITTRADRRRMLNSGYNHKIIRSVYKVSGKLPEVLLTTNLDLRRKR